MTRQVRRHEHFELALDLTNPDFIRPPRDAQRRWLLNRALTEFIWDLEHLHDLAARMVPGNEGALAHDRTNTVLSDAEIMEDWQIPVMQAMARIAATQGGDVLEIGFGRGVSAEMIQRHGVRSHTIVECNDSVVERFTTWRASHADRDIRVIHGRWQDTVPQFGEYDAVFFHTYPLNADEMVEYVARSVTFAEHFFATAAGCLRPGGVFTYLTNEIDSLSRAHQRLLFRHFRKVELEVVGPLQIGRDSRDDLWGQSMVVVAAIK
jgi:guanidinoacetate N-methyltransferase